MKKDSEEDRSLKASLSPWDGVSIIIGIVIGVTIFEAPPLIFSNVGGPWQLMGVWVLGGVLSLIGAFCYAELTTAYPYSGGDYVYLTRAYGRWVGFLFGWAQLAAILTGSIGAMAYVFADYSARLWSLDKGRWAVWLAAASVVLLAVINVLGIQVGKTVQNLLTIAKLGGMAAIVGAGLLWGSGASLESVPLEGPGLGLAMIFVLYTYGGWNDAAFVAADVRDRRKNLPRVLLLGTGTIMVIYVLVNAGYMWGLGFEGVRASDAPAADVLGKLVGNWGSNAMCLVVMISALGAINGMIFTGSRVYASLGADHRVFAILGHWDPRFKAPIWSLATAAMFALLMIFTVGTTGGRAILDWVLAAFGFEPPPWDDFRGGFDMLVRGTAPVFWLFFLLTGVSLFVLRFIDPDRERPFRVPLYPVIPIIFCLTSVYMLYSSLTYARQLALIGLAPLALGIPLYFLSQSMRDATGQDPS
jgi:amino acid transporter